MDIFKILGFCLCALVLLSVLRQYNPGYAVLAALACCMVLLWFVMQALGPVLSFVETLSQFSGFEEVYKRQVLQRACWTAKAFPA